MLSDIMDNYVFVYTLYNSQYSIKRGIEKIIQCTILNVLKCQAQCDCNVDWYSVDEVIVGYHDVALFISSIVALTQIIIHVYMVLQFISLDLSGIDSFIVMKC